MGGAARGRRLEFEDNGARFGSEPVDGIRRAPVGREGGAMSPGSAFLVGGGPIFCRAGATLRNCAPTFDDALCTEFRAGNRGGGRLSSSSSSLSVKLLSSDNTGTEAWSFSGRALGVDDADEVGDNDERSSETD